MQIESAISLRKFANFASMEWDDGDVMARFSQANAPSSRRIVATDQDHVRGLFTWKWHGAVNTAANNQIRQHSILNELKCPGWIPARHGIAEGCGRR